MRRQLAVLFVLLALPLAAPATVFRAQAKRMNHVAGEQVHPKMKGWWVAAGPNGIFTSYDCQSWTRRSDASGNNTSTYGALAVNPSRVLTTGYKVSSDGGLTWSAATDGIRRSGIAWGGTLFTSGRQAGTATNAYWSSNGSTWNVGTGGQTGTFATATSGTLWAAADTLSAKAQSSVDGKAWTTRTIAAAIPTMAYGNGRFCAAGTTKTYYSTDAITWIAENTTTTGNLGRMVWGGNQWVGGTITAGVYTSADCSTWTSRGSVTGFDRINEVAYDGAGKFCAAGWQNTSLAGQSAWSTNGINWTSAHTNSDTDTEYYALVWVPAP